mgnify:CR=1 FL=1
MAGDSSSFASDDSAIDVPIEAEHVAPASGREIVAVVLWTVLADLLIFRSLGFSGPALFLAIVPILFFIGCPRLAQGPASKLTIGLVLLVAARSAWLGSGWTVFAAVALVVALAMSAAGHVPHVLEGGVLTGRALMLGGERLSQFGNLTGMGLRQSGRAKGSWLAWGLPVIAAIVFGAIFVFANPNLFDWVTLRVTHAAERLQLWMESISIWELPFCIVALLIGAGLIRRELPMVQIGPTENEGGLTNQEIASPLYTAFRNTLLTLIVLFTIYLTFEFSTLWKREFPIGFYYAGYAHQGAGWLTFALALATAVLSLIFRGSLLSDNRLMLLRRLAWIWSAQNMLLAVAVYNRLMIYVGYNGMTRLRTVAFFGITVVVIGFVLVLCKIARDRGFWWLIRAQLLAFVLTVIVYSIFPVDYVVHRYNARAVASGYLPPSVMIAVKPITHEGFFPLMSLTKCEDVTIRDGVLALLAERQSQIEETPNEHWTEIQGSRVLLKQKLMQHQAEWAKFENESARQDAIKSFRDYAMQWY